MKFIKIFILVSFFMALLGVFFEAMKLRFLMDDSDIPDYGKITSPQIDILERKYKMESFVSMFGYIYSDPERVKYANDHLLLAGKSSFPSCEIGYSKSDDVIYVVDKGRYFRGDVKIILYLSIYLSLISILGFFIFKINPRANQMNPRANQ